MKKITFLIFLFAFCFFGYGQERDTWLEDFNTQTSNSYGTGTITINSRDWTRSDAGNFSYANTNMGSYAFTINDDKVGAHVTTPSLNTCGTVSFKYAYINGSSDNVFVLQKSYDGSSYSDLETHTLGASSNLNYIVYSYDVNDDASAIYIRVLSDDQNAHLFIEDFSVTDYSGGSAAPSVSTVDANNIGATVADMNGNVTNDGGETVTDRGICYKTSSGVTLSDNQTSAVTSGTGTFSVNVATLSAETQYYFAAYATNSVGTTLASNELDFWTLSTEPTGHSTSFTATASSATQIDLAFDAASGLSADGYIILRRDDYSDPDATGVTDATAPGSLSLPTGTTLVTNITDNTATTYSDMGLTSVTYYSYAILPYNFDGTNEETYNYKTDGTIPTDNATTSAKPEPTNHVLSFAAGTPGSSSIPLTWADNDGAVAADGFLIRAKTVSSFTNPTDGIPEIDDTDMSDGLGQVNIDPGVEAYTFTGLNEGTDYYFIIWPYTNSGSDIDYKLDGVVPTDNETTTTANTDLIISEVTDPGDFYQGRFVELYNLSASTIDFNVDTWYLARQANGGSISSVQLTGTITSGSKYVVGYNDVNFSGQYEFSATLYSGIITGSGDDGYFLYSGGDQTSGTLIDAYGVLNIDGTGEAWEYTDAKAVRLRTITSPNTTWTASEWDIPGSANVDDMTPSAHNEDVSWQATATGTDWNTKSTDNWGGTYGFIPDASFNVTIVNAAPNDPQISAQAACNDLTLNTDAALGVMPGAPLNVYGDLSIATSKSRAAANLVIDGNTTDNGSVIVDGTITGDAVVMRYFEGYNDGALNGWHLIGSPVSNMTILNSDFDPTGTLNDLYQWNESTPEWENYKQGHFSDFTNGYGYLCAFETSDYRTFEGTLNNSEVLISDLSLNIEGWHVLGNPFPSAIEWNTTAWGVTGIAGTAKVWDEDGGNYIDVIAGGIIPSTNGFFVQVSNTTNSLTIPASARVHDDTDNYKNGNLNTEDETLILKASSDENSYYDINRVGFKADATESWDTDFDSHKLFGNEKAPQLWTVTNEENFSLNYLPFTSDAYPVHLNFSTGINGTYHINADGLNSFYQGTDIFLEDLLMDKIVDLNEQSMYTFTATTEDDEARFVLHFYGVTSTGETPSTEVGKIYTYKNTVYVQLSEVPANAYQVEVINIVGQQVYTNEFAPGGLNSFILNEKPGIYFVRLRTENKTIVQKVMISK